MSETLQVHGSAVAFDGRAGLIVGASGSGKSTLALELIGLGADLVADDRVDILREDDRLILSPPARIAGLIEARGAGLIRMPHATGVELTLIADLDAAPPARLPPAAARDLLGLPYPVIFGRGRPGFAAILAAVLRHRLADLQAIPKE